PMERLDILVESRTVEQPDLGDIRRPVAWIAALAFDRFDHRRLFAANIGAGAATKIDLTGLDQAGFFEGGDLMAEDVQYCRILIAHIEVDALGIDCPSRDQRAFEHRVRLVLEIEAVLEGARLAFVAVDGHQSGTRIGPHDLPLAPGGEPRATQASQPSIG